MSFDEDFRGRVAVITGGASGIGLATASRLVSSGAAVMLWDRNPGALAAAAASLGGTATNVRTRELDVTDPNGLLAAANEAEASFGRIDILVASAGITGPTVSAWDYPVKDWTQVMKINLDGVFFSCRAVVPHMVRRG